MLQDWSDYAPPSRRERIGLRIYAAVMLPVMVGGAVVALISLWDAARALYRWAAGA